MLHLFRSHIHPYVVSIMRQYAEKKTTPLASNNKLFGGSDVNSLVFSKEKIDCIFSAHDLKDTENLNSSCNILFKDDKKLDTIMSQIDILERRMADVERRQNFYMAAEKITDRLLHLEELIVSSLIKETNSHNEKHKSDVPIVNAMSKQSGYISSRKETIRKSQQTQTDDQDFALCDSQLNRQKSEIQHYFIVDDLEVRIKIVGSEGDTYSNISSNSGSISLSDTSSEESTTSTVSEPEPEPEPEAEPEAEPETEPETDQESEFRAVGSGLKNEADPEGLLLCQKSIITEYNNLKRRKSLMFEELQNAFFLDTMRGVFKKGNIMRFNLREVYGNFSNNVLTDLDGCFLWRETDTSLPVIYIIESKSRFDKIKIDQKIMQICKLQRSLEEYMKVGSLANCSKKFYQMVKRYGLSEHFRGLDFRLVFSYKFIDRHCIDYLNAINNGSIEEMYMELTLKMFSFNNNYLFLTRKYPHLKIAKNLNEFKHMYNELQTGNENLSSFSLNAIDKFLVDYEYLAEYMDYMKSRIGIMSTTSLVIGGTKLT